MEDQEDEINENVHINIPFQGVEWVDVEGHNNTEDYRLYDLLDSLIILLIK